MDNEQRKISDEELLILLAGGATIASASLQSGLSESTIFRRLRDENFKFKLETYRVELLQRASGQLTAASSEVVQTLLDLQKPEIAPSIRLGAARALMELEIKLAREC